MDRSRVKRFIALEPNVNMHPRIIQSATAAGFDPTKGELVILSCGAEDTRQIIKDLEAIEPGLRVDTVLCVLTLCSVPNGEESVKALVKNVMAPGGQWLFFEHVGSHIPQVSSASSMVS